MQKPVKKLIVCCLVLIMATVVTSGIVYQSENYYDSLSDVLAITFIVWLFISYIADAIFGTYLLFSFWLFIVSFYLIKWAVLAAWYMWPIAVRMTAHAEDTFNALFATIGLVLFIWLFVFSIKFIKLTIDEFNEKTGVKKCQVYFILATTSAIILLNVYCWPVWWPVAKQFIVEVF